MYLLLNLDFQILFYKQVCEPQAIITVTCFWRGHSQLLRHYFPGNHTISPFSLTSDTFYHFWENGKREGAEMWRVHTCNPSVTRCSMWCAGFFGWSLEKSPLRRDSLPLVDNTLLEPPDFSWCYLILLDKHIVPAQEGRRWPKFLTDPKCGIYFQLLHPLPKPSRRNLSRILAFTWLTWTIPGVKYASFPLSFLCD